MNNTIKCPRCGYYGLIRDLSGYYCYECNYRILESDYHEYDLDIRESWDDHDDYDR